MQQRRRKVVELPSTEDINLLYSYAEKCMNGSFSQSKIKFSIEIWKTLASTTFVLVQIFNRKRSGEAERILIDDFKSYQEFDVKKILIYSILHQRNFVGTLRSMSGS